MVANIVNEYNKIYKGNMEGKLVVNYIDSYTLYFEHERKYT